MEQENKELEKLELEMNESVKDEKEDEDVVENKKVDDEEGGYKKDYEEENVDIEDEGYDDKEENEKEGDEEDEEENVKENVKTLLDKIFDGADLTEETKEKIQILFETAVNYEVKKKYESLKEDIIKHNDQVLEERKKELEIEADSYLNYVVEEWIKSNKVELESKVKLDIYESFVSGLRNLFLEHNVIIPEDKTDMIEKLTNKIENLEEDLNSFVRKNNELSEELNQAKKELEFQNVSKGMTDLDVEKFRELVEFDNKESVEDFVKKITLIKESFFSKKNSISDDPSLDDEETKNNEEKDFKIPEKIKKYASLI